MLRHYEVQKKRSKIWLKFPRKAVLRADLQHVAEGFKIYTFLTNQRKLRRSSSTERAKATKISNSYFSLKKSNHNSAQENFSQNIFSLFECIVSECYLLSKESKYLSSGVVCIAYDILLI